jgi:cyclophilin family peptidyl-prolyl cis-trans isomerase
MPNKRARERQLAKLAVRRQAERRARQRRRGRTLGVAGSILAVGLIAVGFATLRGGDGSPNASPSPSGPSPGTKTGTVQPGVAPEKVACGASVPAAAETPKPQFAGPPPTTIDRQGTYTVTMRTSCGTIVLQLQPDRAPATVNSFVFLIRHHFYDGTFFHRIVPSIAAVQGGDPEGTGGGGPGYSIPDELKGNEAYTPGTLAMANAGANTGGSQFFIVVNEKGHNLDGSPNYTIFGRVIEGLDVAKRILGVPLGGAQQDQPQVAVYIDRVTVTEVRSSPSPTASSSPTGSPSA